MLLDYHMHTPLCKHAKGAPEEYVRRAIERDIREIGFSDHNPMPAGYDPNFRMESCQLPEYVAMVERVRKQFPTVMIRLGLEADYFPGTEEYVRQTLDTYDFDYVIGSVHYLGSWGFDNPENVQEWKRRDVLETYARYFEMVKGLAGSGLYDILGHPDVIKKFGQRPARAYDDLMRDALGEVKRAGMALDVNTSGLRYPCREIYPSYRFLEIAREMGVSVTLGSDAHEPRLVGEDFDKAVSLLKSVGYTHVQRFERRVSEPIPLP